MNTKAPKPRKTSKTKHTPREVPQARVELFVEAYCATLNGTEAARRAGYKGDDVTLATAASRLLRKDKVRALIAQRVEELGQDAGANEAVLRLWQIHRADVADLVSHELVADWLIPLGKFPIVTLPASAAAPHEKAVKLGQYKRAWVDLEKAQAKGLTSAIKGLSFFPDGRVKTFALEDRGAARRELLRLMGKDNAPTSAQELALALVQALVPQAHSDGQAQARAWREAYAAQGDSAQEDAHPDALPDEEADP